MQADYIIAGGGGAGLSLLHHLLSSPLRHQQILVIDRDVKQANDRTWCFWSTQIPRYLCARKQRWEAMTFHSAHYTHTAPIAPYTYYHIRGEDFYQEVQQLAADFANVKFLQAEVYTLGETDDSVWVETNLGRITGSFVFSSLAAPPVVPPHPSHTVLAQNFLGWRIKTAQPIFDPEVFTMMDFRAEDQSVPTFFYQLPFSATEALVEVTQFSPHFHSFSGFEKQLHGYITDQLGIKIYAVEEEEMGCIPMTTADYPAKEGVRIYRLGTAGGDTKATTGYTFQNIQRHCAQVVSELLGEQMPRKAGRRYRFLDRLLLHIMREEPTRVSEIMERLFRSTRWPQLLRFLDEDTHLLEEIRMIARLPWSPFLRALSSPKPQTIDATLEDSVASERMAGSE